MALNTRPVVSYSDYDRLPSPHPRNLWQAKNATDWMALYEILNAAAAPSFSDALSYSPIFSTPEGFCDKFQIMKLSFHIIGGSIVDNQLARGLFPSNGRGPQSVQLRNRELKQAIHDFERAFNMAVGAPNIGSFIVSYLHMRLAVSIEQIEILFGKEGEQEARQTCQALKHWSQTPDAREAIWNAGQTLRYYRLILRIASFHVVMAYQAGLVLLAYSVLQQRGENISNPSAFLTMTMPTSLGHSPSPTIILNGTSLTNTEAFINDGYCEPVLLGIAQAGAETSPTCSLQKEQEISRIVSDIIRDRASESGELSPRLVRGLTTLLTDLGEVFSTPAEHSSGTVLMGSGSWLGPFIGIDSTGFDFS